MKFIRLALGVRVLLFTAAVANPANSLTIATSIPELIGDFAPTPSIGVSLGAELREIDQVTLTITAHGTPDIFDTCGTEGCFESVRQPGIAIRFENDFGDFTSIIETQSTFTSDPSTLTIAWTNSLGSWNFLLDGEAQIETRWTGNAIFGTYTQLAAATLVVTQADLAVTGTPVPEPGTAVLVGGGLVLLSRTERRSSNSRARHGVGGPASPRELGGLARERA